MAFLSAKTQYFIFFCQIRSGNIKWNIFETFSPNANEWKDICYEKSILEDIFDNYLDRYGQKMFPFFDFYVVLTVSWFNCLQLLILFK